MARQPVVRSNEHYYHLTGRSNNKENFYLPTSRVWEIMIRKLHLLQMEFDLCIAGFVLMDNHFHLILLTPTGPIDKVMYFFMKDVTKSIQKESGRVNKIFGGRYKGCLIRDQRYLLNAFKYVYRNPVRAKIVERAEEYRFSTLHFIAYHEPLNLKVINIHLPTNESLTGLIQWLNTDFQKNDSDRVKWGLTRSVFQLKKQLTHT
ncbi:MAG: hypothetical protein V4598_03660 [Bdellovibrionota bacterium]